MAISGSFAGGVADEAQVGLGAIFVCRGFGSAGLTGDGHRVVGKHRAPGSFRGHHLHPGLDHSQHIAGKARVIQFHRLVLFDTCSPV